MPGENMIGFFPPAAAGGTLRGVPCRASRWGGKVGWALRVFLRAAARTCWVCPTGRVRWTEGDGIPYRGISHPQSLPLGGRTVRGTVRLGLGKATINHRWPGEAGSDEGAIWYPTFPCRKEKAPTCRPNGIFLLPRWASRSPPHPSPSVTASPQGEASGLCSPTRKSVPNQGTYMGTETAPLPGQCATTAKTSEWERAGHKTGGAGALPRDSLRPGFL